MSGYNGDTMAERDIHERFDWVEALGAALAASAASWGRKTRTVQIDVDPMEGVKFLQGVVNDLNEELGKLRSELHRQAQPCDTCHATGYHKLSCTAPGGSKGPR